MSKVTFTRRIIGVPVALAACLALATGTVSVANASPSAPSASSSSVVGTQAAVTLTVKALTGNTLAGHTLKFYKLGTYTDVTPASGAITGFDLTTGSAMETTISAALAAESITVNGTAIHTLAGLSEPDLHKVALRLATALTGTPDATLTSAKATDTVSLPDEGYYLITDSNGNPVIFGTQSGGRDIPSQQNNTVVIKSTGSDGEGPSITTNPGHDPTDPDPDPGDHIGDHIPGDNKGDSSKNNSKHIVKVAGLKTESYLHGTFALPGTETDHNTDPTATFALSDTTNARLETLTVKIGGTAVNPTVSGGSTYDLSGHPGETVTVDAKIKGTNTDGVITYSSKKSDSSTVTSTADLQLVSIKPSIKLHPYRDNTQDITGTFHVTGGDDNMDAVDTASSIANLGPGTYTVAQTMVPSGYDQNVKPGFTFKINWDGSTTDLTETTNYGLLGSITGGGALGADPNAATSTPTIDVYNVTNLGQLAVTGGFVTKTIVVVTIVAAIAGIGFTVARRHNALA
ncbi:hypothetical protein [Bifidobacterium sp. ESL0732]|uniref:hypothetical protein n=1 Tax=Bifidobacterium sp. ESL0732 TaxID=2983222 RepID=UPI0023F6C5D5|nr:hypothetical protein [Bifidobacterium sp. ESL0732]WEV63784.1 hypothetical protein OZX70_07575 [Bifidobacterium sp. ESL0732]